MQNTIIWILQKITLEKLNRLCFIQAIYVSLVYVNYIEFLKMFTGIWTHRLYFECNKSWTDRIDLLVIEMFGKLLPFFFQIKTNPWDVRNSYMALASTSVQTVNNKKNENIPLSSLICFLNIPLWKAEKDELHVH